MPTIGPSPFVWLQTDQAGALTEPDVAMPALNHALNAQGVGDLVLLCHGWQTDRHGAQALYSTLWGNVCAALPPALDPATVVVAGVLWPSKPFNADYDGGRALSTTAAGGGALALAGAGPGPADLPDDRFEAVLSDMRSLLGEEAAAPLVDAARAIVADPTGDDQAFDFFATARAALGVDKNHPDPELAQTGGLFARADTSIGAQILFGAYAMPLSMPAAPGGGGAQGLGDVIQSAVQGIKNGAAKALNLMSYWTIKARAGAVGQALGAHVLPALTGAGPVRVHLVGHSFGARLVTAVADSFTPHGALRLQDLTLLQSAYSQNGMTSGQGPYAGVLGKVPGPIAMTRTHNDLACSLAYPLASRLSGDTAQGFGEADDSYGAMGANGAQLASSLLAPDVTDTAFAPVKSKVNRFLADAYVVKTPTSDAHNNVANPTCGALVASVIAA